MIACCYNRDIKRNCGVNFQDIIKNLESFWSEYGCTILQPYTTEIGAGTLHPATVMSAINPYPIKISHVQPVIRPADGRYGDNPNRLYQHHQYQVLIKPSSNKLQEAYLASMERIGISPKDHDIQFIEDDWENPSIGAWGLGWEVWALGMEITQFTYFQQVGGLACKPVTGEITYGLERIAMYLQNVESIFN